jgi:thiol:disulfide interchange protein DsbC
MAFPRSGPGSESYNKAVSVWCSKDKQQALTDSKMGMEIAQVSCENPVAKHFEAGRKMGVTGTPALFLENGELLPGYVPPKKLKEILDEHLG